MCFFKKKKTKVSLTSENVTKCVCGKCPVQAKSQCVKGKMEGIQDTLGFRPQEIDSNRANRAIDFLSPS